MEKKNFHIFTKVEVLGCEIPSQGLHMEPSVYSLSLMMLMHNRNDSNQIVFKGLSLFFFF